MFCTNCGAQNAPGATFCQNCGAPLSTAQTQMQPGMQRAPMAPMGAPPMGMQPRRRRPGLVAFLVIGGVVLLAGITILVLWLTGVLFSAPGVVGQWYNDDKQEIIVFEDDGDVEISTPYGVFDGTYTFDQSTGTGEIKLSEKSYEFAIDEDLLAIENIGRYKRDKEESKEFDSALLGDGGNAFGIEVPADAPTEQPADVPTEQPADVPTEQPAVQTQQPAVQQSSVLGLWYEETGYAGTMEFFADGTCVISGYGVEIQGTYTFDAASGQGLITATYLGDTSDLDFALEGDRLYCNMAYYTRDYVYQKTLEEIMEELEG